MQRRGVRLVVVGLAAFSLSGCAVLLLGAGVTTGYAVSKDSVRNQFDLPKDFVYQQGLAVAKDLGLVTLEDAAHGVIRLTVENANVTITVKPLTKKTVELKVKARNQFLMPKVDVAQDVYNRITERLD